MTLSTPVIRACLDPQKASTRVGRAKRGALGTQLASGSASEVRANGSNAVHPGPAERMTRRIAPAPYGTSASTHESALKVCTANARLQRKEKHWSRLTKTPFTVRCERAFLAFLVRSFG